MPLPSNSNARKRERLLTGAAIRQQLSLLDSEEFESDVYKANLASLGNIDLTEEEAVKIAGLEEQLERLQFTNADIIAAEREYCTRSLANFVKRAWPVLEPTTPLCWGWAMDAICQHLEAVSRGEINRLLMNVPPGTMKSLLTSVFWPAYEWGPLGQQHLRYLGTSHKQDLAVRDAMKCRRLIQSDWFQSLWPVKLTSDQNSKTKFENDKTGFREAMAFTSLTGARADRVLLDDPLSVDDGNSQVALQATERTFLEALPTRVNNEHSAIVVIMQRLHDNDTSGVIMREKLPYTHLCLPMRFEEDRRCSTSIGFKDPRQKDGELLFPERFSEKTVTDLEKTLGTYGAAGQLQQRPVPRGGGIFKNEWWRFYKQGVLPVISWRVIYADTAQKTATQNDFSVFQCWGWSQGEKKAYLLDQVRGKWEAPELMTQARAFWMKHKSQQGLGVLRKLKIEDKASGTGLVQQLAKEGIPVEGVKRNVDKVTRAYDVSPWVEAGVVYLPQDAVYLSDLLDELNRFPLGAHDDQVDPLLDAVSDLFNRKVTAFDQAAL